MLNGPTVATPAERSVAASPRLVLVALVVVTLVVRLVPAWMLRAENVDIQSYHRVAESLLRGDTLYLPSVVVFPYMPFSQIVPPLMLKLAEATGWRFDFAIKLPCILADALCAALLWSYLRRRGLPDRSALLWTLAWALNPVSIVSSAFHGNLMAAVPTLVFAAFVLLDLARRSPERQSLLVASGLTLGIGIATRHYAVPILPIFLLFGTRSIGEAVAFTLLAALPTALSAAPYLAFQRETFVQVLLSYNGMTDFGWVAAVRSIPYFVSGAKLQHFDPVVIEGTKRLFVLGVVSLLPLIALFDRERLRAAFLVPPLLFYAVYAGVSAQYFIWVVPFALALRQRLVFPFSVLATTAMVCFYVVYHPDLIFGSLGRPIVESPAVVTTFVMADLGLVLLSMGWVIWIVADGLRHRGPNDLVEGALRSLCLPVAPAIRLLPAAAGLGLIVWLASAIQIGARTIEVARVYLRQ